MVFELIEPVNRISGRPWGIKVSCLLFEANMLRIPFTYTVYQSFFSLFQYQLNSHHTLLPTFLDIGRSLCVS